MIECESDFLWPNLKHQIYAVLIANLVIVGHGSISGWLSPAISALQSNDSPPITGSLTNDEISWLGSISSLGSIVGTFIFGGLVAWIGCKRAMIYLALPSISFWILVYFGDELPDLLSARFISGATAGGIQSGIIIYVSEISNDNIRGRLGSITPLARNVGVLIAYIIAATVDYENIPAILIYIPIIYMICLFFLPNTPQYFLQIDDLKKAEESLKFYKGYEGKSVEEKCAFDLEFERLKSLKKRSTLTETNSFQDFCNAAAFRGVIIAIAMACFLQMTGCFIIINYASLVFRESKTILDSNISSIILAAVQIFGGLLSTSLNDSFGRRIILIISLLGSGFGLLSLTLYLYLSQIGYDLSNYSVLPVICLSFVIFISSAGIAPLSNVCTVENFPPKIRTAGMVFYTLWYNIVAFLGDKYFPVLLEIIELHGCLLIFAIACCVGTLFVILIVPETRGKSYFANSTTYIVNE